MYSRWVFGATGVLLAREKSRFGAPRKDLSARRRICLIFPTMAAFTDQFERRDPATFQPGYVYRGRLTVAVDAAKTLLAGRNPSEVIAIGRVTATIIDAAALVLGKLEDENLRDGSDWYDANSEEDLLAQAENAFSCGEMIRDDLGELGIFLTAEDHLFDAAPAWRQLAVERWEALAVISLWLAIDCVADLRGVGDNASRRPAGFSSSPLDEPFPDGESDDFDEDEDDGGVASILALDVVRASTMATEDRARQAERAAVGAAGASAELLALLEDRERDLQRVASNRAREAAGKRWEGHGGHQDRAMRLANSKPFKSRAAAARYAMEHIDKGNGETFNFETVDGWLKAKGWRRG